MRILLVALALAACDPNDREHGTPDAAPVEPDAPPVQPDAPDVQDESRVYAHSGTVLYRMDNLTLSAMKIGPITGLPNQRTLLDLAVDKNDRLVGVNDDSLFTLDVTTGAATLLRSLAVAGDRFTSLTFSPKDWNDPNSADILVTANNKGEVFEIDPTTGQIALIGNYGTHSTRGKIKSSGDLIAVRGFGIYATVDVGTETMDVLAKIDPVTWKATLIGTNTGFDKIFGLGYWNGIIYGFVDDGFDANTGRMIQIDPNTGAGLLLNQADIRWFGAGVATDAPVIN